MIEVAASSSVEVGCRWNRRLQLRVPRPSETASALRLLLIHLDLLWDSALRSGLVSAYRSETTSALRSGLVSAPA
jgi:hypothetical protein